MAILPILKHAASVEVGGRSVSIMTAVVSPVRPSPPPESVTTSCYNLDNRGGRVWMFVSLLLLGQITMPLNAQPTKLTQFISSHFDNSAASSSPLSSSTPGYYHSSSTRSLLPVPYTNETTTTICTSNSVGLLPKTKQQQLQSGSYSVICVCKVIIAFLLGSLCFLPQRNN
eukprot:GHVS01107120.1.p1 GENE.GHVS01107120.1~~GHVS01107120.1.p1  ORF type:complete len:171 (+),score=35.52 GHVS01107120.1:74-586(+)